MAFTIPILLIGLLSLAGFLWSKMMFIEAADVSALKIRNSLLLNETNNELSRSTKYYAVSYDPQQRKIFDEAVNEQKQQLQDFKNLPYTDEEKKYYAEVEKQSMANMEVQDTLFKLADQVADNTNQERELMQNNIKPLLEEWNNNIQNDDKDFYAKKLALTQLEIHLMSIIITTKYQMLFNQYGTDKDMQNDYAKIKQLFDDLGRLNLSKQEIVWLNQLHDELDKILAIVINSVHLDERQTNLMTQEESATSQIASILDDKLYVIAYARDKSIEHTIINMSRVLIATLIVLILISMLSARAFSKYLLRPVNYFKGVIQRLRSGEEVVVERLSNDEIGELSDAFGYLIQENKSHSAELSSQNWLKEHIAEILKTAQTEKTLEAMCNVVTTKIAKLLEAGCGAFYITQEDGVAKNLILLGTYGYKSRKNISNQFKFGESLVGQAALEGKPIILSEVPEDYIHITSGLGDKHPSYIIVLPILLENKTLGVMEFALFHKLTDIQQQFLEQLSTSLAVVMEAIQSRQRTEEALKKVQESAEELQVQQEELRSTNEELEEKTHVLQKSEEELKSQSEEMQASNEELEEKMHSIEQQKKEIQTKNNELEEIKKQLEIKAVDLARAGKYKTEFLANMSHELRTPLNSLLLLSNAFAKNEDGNLTPDQIEQANIIHKGGKDLLTLINDILDLSKVEAGKLNMQIEEAKVSDILSDLQTQFESMISAKGLEFIIESTLKDNVIKTDAYRLKQILRNLISNAVKFTNQGFIKLTANLTTDNYIVFKVIDTGIGIEKQKFQDIFEAFQQAYGDTDRTYGGTGLGLTISRELAKLLGGEIVLDSELGKGSVFSLMIPVATNSVTQPEKQIILAENTMSSLPDDRNDLVKNDKKILIVESDKKFIKTLMQMTKQKGYKCITALNADTGLNLSKQYKPDGIIIDLDDSANSALIQELKTSDETRNIPIHVISNNDMNDLTKKFKSINLYRKTSNAADLEEVFKFFNGESLEKNLAILLVEDDNVMQDAISRAAKAKNINIVVASTAHAGLEQLRAQKFAGIILDLKLPDMDGIDLLKSANDELISLPPIIVHSEKDLTEDEFARINQYTNKIVVKEGDASLERLLNECTLFLHAVNKNTPQAPENLKMHLETDKILQGKDVLLVDDDMRNVYALSMVLKRQGMNITIATNGEEALKKLDTMPKLDIVIMDIMMPVMDGFETTRRIRKKDQFKNLPIIAVTAKAMPNDKTACIEAGANDYITKPIDAEKLLSMMRVWLSSAERSL